MPGLGAALLQADPTTVGLVNASVIVLVVIFLTLPTVFVLAEYLRTRRRKEEEHEHIDVSPIALVNLGQETPAPAPAQSPVTFVPVPYPQQASPVIIDNRMTDAGGHAPVIVGTASAMPPQQAPPAPVPPAPASPAPSPPAPSPPEPAPPVAQDEPPTRLRPIVVAAGSGALQGAGDGFAILELRAIDSVQHDFTREAVPPVIGYVPPSGRIDGDIVHPGYLQLAPHCVIAGGIDAAGSLALGEGAYVLGPVHVSGNLYLRPGARLEGVARVGGQVFLAGRATAQDIEAQGAVEVEDGGLVQGTLQAAQVLQVERVHGSWLHARRHDRPHRLVFRQSAEGHVEETASTRQPADPKPVADGT